MISQVPAAVVGKVRIVEVGIPGFVIGHVDDRTGAAHAEVQIVKQKTVFARQVALHGYDSGYAPHGL